jgi:hypothetical protein
MHLVAVVLDEHLENTEVPYDLEAVVCLPRFLSPD